MTCIMFESKGGPGWWLTPEASVTSVSSARGNSNEAWEGPYVAKLLLQKRSNPSILCLGKSWWWPQGTYRCPLKCCSLELTLSRREKYGYYTHVDGGNPRWGNSKGPSDPCDWQAPSICRKFFPHLVIQVLKGFSYRKTTLFLIFTVRWKGLSQESSETWGTECTQGSGLRDFHLLWKAFSFWMLSSLFYTLLPGGNPAAGPICALKKRVPCPSSRNPIASRLGVPRGAGLQMLRCGKQMAGSCSWQDSLGSWSPEEISAGCSETPTAAQTAGTTALGAREAGREAFCCWAVAVRLKATVIECQCLLPACQLCFPLAGRVGRRGIEPSSGIT